MKHEKLLYTTHVRLRSWRPKLASQSLAGVGGRRTIRSPFAGPAATARARAQGLHHRTLRSPESWEATHPASPRAQGLHHRTLRSPESWEATHPASPPATSECCRPRVVYLLNALVELLQRLHAGPTGEFGLLGRQHQRHDFAQMSRDAPPRRAALELLNVRWVVGEPSPSAAACCAGGRGLDEVDHGRVLCLHACRDKDEPRPPRRRSHLQPRPPSSSSPALLPKARRRTQCLPHHDRDETVAVTRLRGV